MYPSELGSKLKSLNDSNIVFSFVLSSPLRTSNEKVPLALLTFPISHLILSDDPDTKDPSLFCDPASPLL